MKTLNGMSQGRFEVITESGSRYIVDLDRKTFTRRPAMDMSVDRSLRRDGEEAALLEIVDCTVGRGANLVIDLGWPGVEYTVRRTTFVIMISRITE